MNRDASKLFAKVYDMAEYKLCDGYYEVHDKYIYDVVLHGIDVDGCYIKPDEYSNSLNIPCSYITRDLNFMGISHLHRPTAAPFPWIVGMFAPCLYIPQRHSRIICYYESKECDCGAMILYSNLRDLYDANKGGVSSGDCRNIDVWNKFVQMITKLYGADFAEEFSRIMISWSIFTYSDGVGHALYNNIFCDLESILSSIDLPSDDAMNSRLYNNIHVILLYLEAKSMCMYGRFTNNADIAKLCPLKFLKSIQTFDKFAPDAADELLTTTRAELYSFLTSREEGVGCKTCLISLYADGGLHGASFKSILALMRWHTSNHIQAHRDDKSAPFLSFIPMLLYIRPHNGSTCVEPSVHNWFSIGMSLSIDEVRTFDSEKNVFGQLDGRYAVFNTIVVNLRDSRLS
jgi:hypothetical protein